VLATGGGEPVLDAQALGQLKAAAAFAPLIIDFGVPPNIDPAAAQGAGVARVGMNDLIEAAQGRRLAQLVRLAPVRAAIDERLTRLRSELATRAIGPRLADLRGAFEQIAAEEVARALRQELRTLDDPATRTTRAARLHGGAPARASAARGTACRRGAWPGCDGRVLRCGQDGPCAYPVIQETLMTNPRPDTLRESAIRAPPSCTSAPVA